MFPEVPIALRLSGHLLLGVVRIYSRKVNYLYQDCSEALVKIQAFTSVQVDLPPGAATAPFHSITLPETFEFDDIEEELRYGKPDTHVTTRDQITLNEWRRDFAGGPQLGLNEQVPGEVDPFTMVYLDEEVQKHKSPAQSEFPRSVLPSREEDVLPPLPMDDAMGFGQMDMEIDGLEHTGGEVRGEAPLENIPERETLRSAAPVTQEEPFIRGLEELEKGIDVGDETETSKMEETGVPILGETPMMGGGTPRFGQRQTPHSITPGEISGDDDLLTAVLGGMSPGLTVMPTPTKSPAQEERKRIPRKRKQLFDESIVLSNEFMKRQLEYTDDICRIRRKVPCSARETWKEYRSSHMQQIFSEPSLPGMSTHLQEIFKKVFTAKGVKVAFAEAPTKGFKNGVEEPLESPQAPDIEMARFAPPGVETLPDVGFETAGQMEEPTYPANEEVELDTQIPEVLVPENVIELEEASTAEPKASEFATPSQYGLSGVSIEEAPSVGISVYEKEHKQGLEFLEEDSRHAVFVVQGEEEFTEESGVGDAVSGLKTDDTSGWSVRTRAVAQYLRTAFQKLDTQEKRLNLCEMLAGRTRKESARMFFETLVLKSKDYLGANQEEPYADIHLLPREKLMKAKF
ncbi:sister chromatid cohesion 1 protein 4 isoform X2 [Cryptomeria japonica]|nr:sister chromatid cohesion 1 protein 4 isoform X2 [Cryptomeria japonica]